MSEGKGRKERKKACAVKTVVIASGASGGHLFPALAVADVLKEQGYHCIFVGNGRGFEGKIEAAGYRFLSLPASAWNVRNPFKKALALFNLMRAFFIAFKLLHKEKACTVLGTGGYASVATIMAAKVSGISTCIQEQNVLPGRANRFLARFADKICLSFEESRHYLRYRRGAIVVCGNPLRKAVLEAEKTPKETKDSFQITVLGGSQGARILSDVVPEALCLFAKQFKKPLTIIQQARVEDIDRVKIVYATAIKKGLEIETEVSSFFEDIPQKMVQSDLVIGRSGTSTVMECCQLSCPAVFVPLKLADGHQLLNAQVMASVDAAVIVEQQDFTVENLAATLKELTSDKNRLSKMAKNAKKIAVGDAAEKVAKEVMHLADEDVMHLAEEIEIDDESQKTGTDAL